MGVLGSERLRFMKLEVFSTLNTVMCMFPPDALQEYGQGALFGDGNNATAGIFATYPSQHLSLLNGFFDQVTIKSSQALFIWHISYTGQRNVPHIKQQYNHARVSAEYKYVYRQELVQLYRESVQNVQNLKIYKIHKHTHTQIKNLVIDWSKKRF